MSRRLRASHRQRADLFGQLAAMEDAGLPAARALETVAASTDGPFAASVGATARAVAGGRDLATAAERAGIFDAADAAMVRAGAAAGRAGAVFRGLADIHGERAEAAARLRARALMPVFVLVLAVLVAPLPDLLGGRIGVLAYVGSVLYTLLRLAVVAWVVLRLPFWLRRGALAGLGIGPALDRIAARLPVLGPAHVRRQRTRFLETLGLMLDAGVPAASAVPLASTVVDNREMAGGLARLAPRLEAGHGLAEVLAETPWLPADGAGLLASGEAAGRLAHTMTGYARLERERVRLFDEALADWAPRILYLAVAAWIAGSLLG